MTRTKNIFTNIFEDSKLINDFKNLEDFKEFYKFCKKIEPTITYEEIRKKSKDLINKNNNDRLVEVRDSELRVVSGGKMEFNKFKSLIIATSVLTGIVAVSDSSSSACTPVKSLSTVISSSKEEVNFKLSTTQYGVEIVNSTEQNLHLQGNIFNSGMKFIKHEVKKEGSAVFIYIYGALITDSDFKEQQEETAVDVDFKIPYTTAVIEPDFDIQYTIPNDVDAVYLCGKAKDDLKIIWEKQLQE